MSSLTNFVHTHAMSGHLQQHESYLMWLRNVPRMMQKWIKIKERFEESHSPEEEDIRMILDTMRLLLRMVGASGSCLQESGNPNHSPITLSSDACKITFLLFDLIRPVSCTSTRLVRTLYMYI